MQCPVFIELHAHSPAYCTYFAFHINVIRLHYIELNMNVKRIKTLHLM